MTTLTYESLEDAIRNIRNFMESPEDTIALRPTKLIVSGDIHRYLLLRHPVRKLGGPRGRARALKRRPVSLITKMFFQRSGYGIK